MVLFYHEINFAILHPLILIILYTFCYNKQLTSEHILLSITVGIDD